VHGVETILFLVVLGTVVAAFAGRLRVPAPALLVIAGLVVGLLPGFPPVHVPPDVVSLVVLPPLLYAASEELPWRDLRAVWRPVAVLAVGLVLASAAAVAAVAWAVAAVPVSMAFVLGAVLASTDPVAVSALGGGWRCRPGCRRWCRPKACSTTRPAWCCSRSRCAGPGRGAVDPADHRQRSPAAAA